MVLLITLRATRALARLPALVLDVIAEAQNVAREARRRRRRR